MRILGSLLDLISDSSVLDVLHQGLGYFLSAILFMLGVLALASGEYVLGLSHLVTAGFLLPALDVPFLFRFFVLGFMFVFFL